MGIDHENHRESTHGVNISYSLARHKTVRRYELIMKEPNFSPFYRKKGNGFTVPQD